MAKYIDLLNKLNSLTPEQLECEIKILHDGNLVEHNIEVIVDENPLYAFDDTNMRTYYDFESDENAEEYDLILKSSTCKNCRNIS